MWLLMNLRWLNLQYVIQRQNFEIGIMSFRFQMLLPPIDHVWFYLFNVLIKTDF